MYFTFLERQVNWVVITEGLPQGQSCIEGLPQGA
ncbi:hypothetical protein A2U01_0032588, partial [Trifolium medium]|nr:hypothetical protein [Trifolium medium]